jgi:hypothetical protein
MRLFQIAAALLAAAGVGALAIQSLRADEKKGEAAAAAPNTLTDAEKAAGFKLLFDGKSLDGWKGYRKDKPGAGWETVDGSLVLNKKGAGDIITVEEFGAFELLIDWKISPKGNSGVMYHCDESEGAPYMTGPEMQVLDNKGHGDGKNPLTSAGACYALYPPAKDMTKPVGEWNSARLVVHPDGKVEHWLNGEKVVEYVKGSDEWKDKVAKSKFKGWKKFGTLSKGHIDLQDHGDHVEFRNIKVRSLEEKK